MIKNIGVIIKTEREEIVSSKYNLIASEWKNIVTSSEVKINIVKNKKKNKTTGNRSKSKNTIRNIDKVNIKRYDKNIQKYLGRKRKFNISTREEKRSTGTDCIL